MSPQRPYFKLKNVELEAAMQTDRQGVLFELDFRSSRAAKKLKGSLSSAAEPAPADRPVIVQAKPTAINFAALQAKAARLEEQAKACHGDRLTNTPKRLAQAMHKRMDGDRIKRQAAILYAAAVLVQTDYNGPIASLKTVDIIAKAQEASLYECKMICNGYHSYNVEMMDKPRHTSPIHEELRALINPAQAPAEAKKSAQIQAEAELRNCNISGFFPTPPAVIAVMLEQAGDLRGKLILEPSAGKGDLVKAALDAGAKVRAFEIVPKLAAYCQAHVGPVKNADFLEQTCIVIDTDVVLMNPPFERDAAPKHVLHALTWLKEGGRLIAVMPANWAEKSSADALHDAISEKGLDLLEIEVERAAFNGADAFRQTGVSTTIIVIKS